MEDGEREKTMDDEFNELGYFLDGVLHVFKRPSYFNINRNTRRHKKGRKIKRSVSVLLSDVEGLIRNAKQAIHKETDGITDRNESLFRAYTVGYLQGLFTACHAERR